MEDVEPPEAIGVFLHIGSAQFMSKTTFGYSDNHKLVRNVLADYGIDMASHYKGIAVPYWQADEARTILLTDTRLKDRDIHVILLVPAGVGQETDNGVTIEYVEPFRPKRRPPQ